MYTNCQKLAAVVSHWAKPAIADIASNKVSNIPLLKNLEHTIVSTGLVRNDYNIVSDIKPFVSVSIQSLIQPMLERYFSQIPDASIPELAHNIVDTAMQNGEMKLLDGAVTFEMCDLEELKDLLNRNIPLEESEDGYQII